MTSDSPRDGDLPPGVYERQNDGTLVMSKKVFTPDPPRPANISADGKITNVTQDDLEYLKDIVVNHKEIKIGHSITASPSSIQRIRDFCSRVAESIMEKK